MTTDQHISPYLGNKNGTSHPQDDIHADGEVKTRPRVDKPRLYKVFLLNDDYTPMDFVVDVLESFFGKSHQEATRIMMNVHSKGVGLCGVYSFEIAETKISMVLEAARAAQHPLQCRMEKE